MNKPLILFVFLGLLMPLLCFSAPGQAQVDQFPHYGIFQYFVPNPASNLTYKFPNLYINSNFEPGKLVTTDNKEIIPTGIRYNISDDVMECKLNSQYSRISSPEELRSVEINGKHFAYKKYVSKRRLLKGYLQRVHKGTKNLYVRYTSKAIDKKTGKAIIEHIFLLEEAGRLPIQVKSARNAIISIFKGMDQTSRRFMSEHGLKWNSPDDVIKLATYLDKLSANNVASR